MIVEIMIKEAKKLFLKEIRNNTIRYEILKLLYKRGVKEKTTSDLVEHFDKLGIKISRTAITNNCKVLEKWQVIESKTINTIKSREVVYSLTQNGIDIFALKL